MEISLELENMGDFSSEVYLLSCVAQVNGVDLAEIEGGEVSITNFHSCNGPEFVLQLHFSINQDDIGLKPGKQNTILVFFFLVIFLHFLEHEHYFPFPLVLLQYCYCCYSFFSRKNILAFI